MKTSKITLGLAALVGMLAVASSASAGTSYMAASGFPFNNTALSNYSIADGNVYFTAGNTWAVPVPVPTSSSVVTRTLQADYGNMCAVQAWSLNFSTGTTYSGVSFSNFSASINVPVNGSLFFKGVACSNLQARVSSVMLVN